MADETTEKVKKDNTIIKEAVLSHIDKLYSTMVKIWESSNLLIMSESVLCFVIIALSTSFVSIEEVSFVGIKFKLSLTALLCIGAILVLFLHIAFFYQMSEAEKFRLKIVSLYKSISYEDVDSDYKTGVSYANAFDYPNIYLGMSRNLVEGNDKLNKWERGYHTIVGIVVLLLFIGMPVTAQIAAGLKVCALNEWALWVIFVFAVLIFLTISSVAIHITTLDKEFE